MSRGLSRALDIMATVEPKTEIDPNDRTGLYPVMSKLVRDEGEKLRRDKVTRWAFFHSGNPMRVVDFYGKEITCSGSGVTFEGSPRRIFWGRYIEPFLEDIVLRMLDRTVALCKDEGHEVKPALMETGLLLIISGLSERSTRPWPILTSVSEGRVIQTESIGAT